MRRRKARRFRPVCDGVLWLLLLAVWAVPNFSMGAATASKQEQIRNIEDKLSSEKRKLEAFDFQEKGLLEHLADLEREVEGKRKAVEALRVKVQEAGLEVKRLNDLLKSLDLKSKELEKRVAKRVVNLYKYARRGYMRTLADAGGMEDLRQRVKYARAVMKEDQKILRGFADEELACRNEVAAIRRKVSVTENRREEEQKALTGLRQDLEQKVLRLMNVHKEKEFYETAVRELESAATDLRSTLKRIEGQSSGDLQGDRRFEEQQGRLPLPLRGRMVRGSDFGPSSRMALHKGIFIEGPPNGEVIAVFPGKVEFSGNLKGYGEILIVNHGSRYFTITGLLMKRLKKEGDLVSQGEVVGLIGSGEDAKKRRLYFEIRRAGENLDPQKWFGSR